MKLSAIHINPANPRVIKDDRFKKLCQSIREFPKMMKLRPLIVDSDGMILGGNMRFKALKKLGYKEVPDEWIKRNGDLTDEEKQRFIISDNIQLGEWDLDILKLDWDKGQLEGWGLDIEVNEITESKQINILPYNKAHLFISYPLEYHAKINEVIKELFDLPIEIERSAN